MASKRIRTTLTRRQTINHIANEKARKQVSSIIKEARLEMEKDRPKRRIFESVKAMQTHPSEKIKINKEGRLFFQPRENGKFLSRQFV